MTLDLSTTSPWKPPLHKIVSALVNEIFMPVLKITWTLSTSDCCASKRARVCVCVMLEDGTLYYESPVTHPVQTRVMMQPDNKTKIKARVHKLGSRGVASVFPAEPLHNSPASMSLARTRPPTVHTVPTWMRATQTMLSPESTQFDVITHRGKHTHTSTNTAAHRFHTQQRNMHATPS